MFKRAKFFLTLSISCLVIASGCINTECKHCNKKDHKHLAKSEEKSSAPVAQADETKTASTENAILSISSMEEFKTKVLQSTKPVVVDCTAVWCGACKTMKPVFTKVAQDLGSQYLFVTVDVDQVSQVSDQYNISGIPTFLLFSNGQEVNAKNRLVGIQKEASFKTALAEAFAQPASAK